MQHDEAAFAAAWAVCSIKPAGSIELGYVDPRWGVAHIALLVVIVFLQTLAGRQILIGGTNSPSALLSALGQQMPFRDRDIDLIVVPKADARSLNGLLAVVDRYRVGQIVSVEVSDNRAAREWTDMIAAKQIEVIEAGLGIGIEDGVSLSLDTSGWAQIDVGATVVGIGSPPMDAHADVIVLDEVAGQTAAWLTSTLPQIVVTRSPVKPERAVEGVAFVDAEMRAAELIFDGTQWEVKASP